MAETSDFTKNDLFCRYFAKILTRNTKKLLRRKLHDDYSKNIKGCNSSIY